MLATNQIYNMDCLEGLKQLDDESVDLIVSDPPYQLSNPKKTATTNGGVDKGFMNKEWDVLPTTQILKECLRVMKSGAFSFWLMTPRQDSQLEFLLRLREAGFVISFSPIFWLYASGFPKAMSISKAIDRKFGVEREVTGTDKKFGRADSGIYEFNNGDKPDKYEYDKKDIPATPEAKKFEGAYAGFQPKPATEVVVVAMKPLSEKTYVDQALKNGKGVTWLDDVRVPYSSDADKQGANIGYDQEDMKTKIHSNINMDGGFGHKEVLQGAIDDRGRFPANIIVNDDMLNNGVISKGQQGATKGNEPSTQIQHHIYGDFSGFGKATEPRGDTGSYSRYFDLDKWWEEKKKTLTPEEIKSVEEEKKPATEVVVVAMKPLSEKTFVDQALENGKGVTWLNDCRIPFSEGDEPKAGHRTSDFHNATGNPDALRTNAKEENPYGWEATSDGRFPANVIVNDDMLNDGVSGKSVGHNPNVKTTGFGEYGGGKSERDDTKEDTYIHDTGTFSRYFDLDRWWGDKIKKLPQEVRKTFPYLIVPKPSPSEKNDGLDNLPEKKMTYEDTSRVNKETADKFGCERKSVMQNIHPTVKPLDLMSYLVILGSRENDLVLDPFIGSGTTAISCRLFSRKFIGFEREPEYFKIAENRLKDHLAQKKLFEF